MCPSPVPAPDSVTAVVMPALALGASENAKLAEMSPEQMRDSFIKALQEGQLRETYRPANVPTDPKQLQELRAAYQKQLRDNPTQPQLNAQLGRVCLALNDFNEAIDKLSTALDNKYNQQISNNSGLWETKGILSKRDLLVLRAIAYLLKTEPDYSKAFADLQQALKIDPNRASVNILLAQVNILRQKPNFENAVSLLNRAAGLIQGQEWAIGEHGKIAVLLGLAEFAKGNYLAAEKHFLETQALKHPLDSWILEKTKEMLLWMYISSNSPLKNSKKAECLQNGQKYQDAHSYDSKLLALREELDGKEDKNVHLQTVRIKQVSAAMHTSDTRSPREVYEQGEYLHALAMIKAKLKANMLEVKAAETTKEAEPKPAQAPTSPEEKTASPENEPRKPQEALIILKEQLEAQDRQIKALKRQLNIQEEKPELLLLKAEIEIKLGRYRTALRTLNLLLDGCDEDNGLWPHQIAEAILPQAHFQRALLHREAYQWSRAIGDAEKYLTLEKEPPPEKAAYMHYIIGLAQLMGHHLGEAATSFSSVLKLGEQAKSTATVKNLELIATVSLACDCLEWMHQNAPDKKLQSQSREQLENIRKLRQSLPKIE